MNRILKDSISKRRGKKPAAAAADTSRRGDSSSRSARGDSLRRWRRKSRCALKAAWQGENPPEDGRELTGWASTYKYVHNWTPEAKNNADEFMKKYAELGIEGIKAEFKKEVEPYTSPTYADTAFRANPAKNENNDVVTCLDDSRVELSDKTYINASWAYDADKFPLKYILTQRPLSSTAEDFWQMIYEHKIMFVMISYVPPPGKDPKAPDFWPTRGERVFGKMTVYNDKVHRRRWMHRAVAELEVRMKGRPEKHTTSLVHVHGVPVDASRDTQLQLLKMIEMVDMYHTNLSSADFSARAGPVVLMDDASGCSMAACFLLADVMGTLLYTSKKMPSLPALAQWLRRCRHGAIRTADEYLLVVQTIAARYCEQDRDKKYAEQDAKIRGKPVEPQPAKEKPKVPAEPPDAAKPKSTNEKLDSPKGSSNEKADESKKSTTGSKKGSNDNSTAASKGNADEPKKT